MKSVYTPLAGRPAPPPTSQRAQAELSWTEERIDWRVVIIAILATVAFHGSAYFALPTRFALTGDETWAQSRALDLEIVPLEQPEEELAERFVETNPNTPENEPDETQNFSDRDQQAANPERPDDIDEDNGPRLDGLAQVGPALTDVLKQDEEMSPEEALAAMRQQQPQPPVDQNQPRDPQPDARDREEVPPPMAPPQAPDFITAQVDELDEEGMRTAQEIVGEGDETAPLYDDNEIVPLNIVESEYYTENSLTEDPAQQFSEPVPPQQQVQQPQPPEPQQVPRPRPRLPAGSVSQLVRDSPSGVGNVGPIALDARWRPFGEYLAQVDGAGKLKWINLARAIPGIENERQSRVRVKFTLHADGSITEVEIVERDTQGASAAFICTDAIKAPSPYRPWTPEMIEEMGESTTMVFGFWYY